MKLLNKWLFHCGTASSSAVIGFVVVAGLASPAHAYTFNTSPDWDIELDSNIAYGLGIRAQHRNDEISNNPIQQNDEYKFPNFGNITSSRFDVATELSIAYQHSYGVDVSFAGWKDFAYNGGPRTNPGNCYVGISIPCKDLSSAGSHYSSFTNNYYNLGGELENGFAFADFSVGNVPVSVKVGRFTEYWGNALFSAGQAISYGQSPIDEIKAVDAPGAEVKDLFLPRGQVSLRAEVSQTVALGFQYQFEYRSYRFPEGGTFLGIADPFFIGPQSIEGAVHRGNDNTPTDLDGNFGVEALYSPNFLGGTVGLYFRQFDDPVPYAPASFGLSPTGVEYHLGYARHIHMYAISLDNNIGNASTSFEASIRSNTGLNTVPANAAALAYNPTGNDGARGNTFNFVANAIYGLTPTPLWQTGSLVAEIAWSHLLAVTHDAQLYNAEGYACAAGGLNAGSGEKDGCATEDNVSLNILFDPQWLQVFPGIDIDAPFSLSTGLHGNGQALAYAATGNEAGSFGYSAGVHMLYKQIYSVKLDYSGFTSPTDKITKTPDGNYYASGSGEYMFNDKGQVQLTFSTAF